MLLSICIHEQRIFFQLFSLSISRSHLMFLHGGLVYILPELFSYMSLVLLLHMFKISFCHSLFNF